jgi:hypothetical protein
MRRLPRSHNSFLSRHVHVWLMLLLAPGSRKNPDDLPTVSKKEAAALAERHALATEAQKSRLLALKGLVEEPLVVLEAEAEGV